MDFKNVVNSPPYIDGMGNVIKLPSIPSSSRPVSPIHHSPRIPDLIRNDMIEMRILRQLE